MASQSLYRKWRSQAFSELVGQEGVVRTLLNAVRDGRLAHAYLFCGPRGTGKTSVARLLAKAINCANPHDGEPCNECVSCRELTAGFSPDVIEIDAASNTGVDNIRDIRQNVNLLGGNGHHRVFIIDEVHMLSTSAFNALLKTLEEPPPHVIFVLATTEAHKVLPTIISRCQRFDFHRIRMADIVAHLDHVAAGEGLRLEPAAAEMIARAAQGGMRDALSLLDQAITFAGTAIDADSVRKMLGLADPASLRALIEAVCDQDTATGLERIHRLVTEGADPRQLSAQYAEEWRAMMLAQAGADVATIMDRTPEEARTTATLAARFSLEQLAACARIFARNEQPARGLPVPQLALELAFLECVSICAPDRPDSARATSGDASYAPQPHAQPHAQLQPTRPMQMAPQPAGPRPAPRETVRPAPINEPAEPADELAEVTRMAPSQPAHQVDQLDQAAEEYQDDPVEGITAAAPPEAPAQQDGALLNVLQDIQRRWEMVKKVCKQKSSMVSGLLNGAQPVHLDAGSPPLLTVTVKFNFHLEKLREPEKREAVEWALEQVLERPIRIRFVLASEGGQGAPRLPGTPPPDQPRRATSSTTGQRPAASASTGAPGSAASGAARETPDNIVPFPAAHSANRQTPARDASRPTSEPPATTDIDALEREVRADPVIQELMRTSGADLTEVRPLEDDERP